MSKKRNDERIDQGTWIAVGTAFVAACTAFWLSKVSEIVPDPYLDEVFHVRQAQVYCRGDFKTWDPKITTPPGLYLVSYLIYRVTGQCSITALRSLNAGTLIISPYLTYRTILNLSAQSGSKAKTLWSALSAVNIWLFPPLFFFSGLYYTDIQSAFWVLLAFQSYLCYEKNEGGFGISDAASQFRFGIIALLFRQTNIFWVAVFPAGLAVVSVLQHSTQRAAIYKQDAGILDVCRRSWMDSIVYDPPVADAWIEDYVKTVLSIAIVTLRNLPKVILPLAPYIALIATFGAFLFYNGGVVLGDKSNHVVTLHLPQMLYLWPYMIFFSIPVVLPPIFNSMASSFTYRPNGFNILRQIAVFTISTVLAAVVIHYNTIVHPFTLADNRHYVFYVFRLLLRYPMVKYLAAPVYILGANIVIQALGSRKHTQKLRRGTSAAISSTTRCSTSFVIIWFATTALSLITAPLVEPRYCIIPWIMWRLYVPRLETPVLEEKKEKGSWIFETLQRDETRLLLETLWFCCINVATGYVFLYWGFTWPQEEGKIQRFMW